ATGELSADLVAPPGAADIAFVGSARVATGGVDARIHVFDVGEPAGEVQALAGHRAAVRCVVAMPPRPDLVDLATGDEAGDVLLWKANRGTLRKGPPAGQLGASIRALAASSDGGR